jgi:pimeloyl-ACP methyl ester carboxylesterase
VLVAHSMGGMVAQHLAADRPDLVLGLVLSATSGRADEPMRATFARWDALLEAGAIEEFSRDAIDSSFTGIERARRRRTLREEGVDEVPPTYVARHLALSAACGLHDATDRLHEILAPTLVLAAAGDRVIPPVHSQRLAEALPDARLHVFAGVGHGFPEQDVAGYRREVEPFLERLLGR